MLGPLTKPDRPIFIVGAARSGTTLVARILGSHSRIFMPGETHFFNDIYARRKELGEPRNPRAMERIIQRLLNLYQRYNEPSDQERIDDLFSDATVLDHLRTTCTSYRDIFSYFMNIQMAFLGKARWGNHVPKDIFNMREIVSFFTDAKILVCVRDVRDFLLSYKFRWKTTSQQNEHRIKKLYHPILTALLWKSSIKQIRLARRIVPVENLKIVQYESLVRNPAEIITEICTFIEEEFEAGMLEVKTHNSSFTRRESGIFSSSVEEWRRGLSKEEAYLAQKITSPELRELGYGVEKMRVNPLSLSCMAATFPYALCKALNANRQNTGPLLPYLRRRVVAFLQ